MDPTNNRAKDTIQLTKTQAALKKCGIDALLIRSCDRYFNEYVPKNLSIRYLLTNFDGSVGDALITKDSAHLFVDGRYALQAETQAKGFTIHVCQNAQSIEGLWLDKLTKIIPDHGTLAYDPHTIDLKLFDKLSEQATQTAIQLQPNFIEFLGNLVDIGGFSLDQNAHVFLINTDLSGLEAHDKLKCLQTWFSRNNLQGFLATKLDDIAWITNLRSFFFPYQSALPGIAAIFPEKIIFGVASGLSSAQKYENQWLSITKESDVFQAIKHHLGANGVLGISQTETAKAHELSLHKHEISFTGSQNPLSLLKAKKNENELLHFRSAFKKADLAVYQTQQFVVESFEQQQTISESDVDRYIKEAFTKSGAQELSFRPICASKENGAIIHYGHPSNEKILAQGSLFLLDTGAYYQGGYATDLTRTFLAAKKSAQAAPWQQKMFTLVLKASIRGLSARIKRGTLGMQLDAIVRAPLWQAGLDFAHGTGHGVGINVHEFPPRIGPTSTSELLEGHVFSIEPGLYFAGLGGVRIENLATIVADPDHEQFLRVLPLTFCPLDHRLIDKNMLDDYDKLFLNYFEAEWKNEAPWPNLPPLSTVAFSA